MKLPCEKGNSLFNLEVSHAILFLETNPSTCLAVHHVHCISSFFRRKVLDDSERLRRLKRRSTDAVFKLRRSDLRPSAQRSRGIGKSCSNSWRRRHGKLFEEGPGQATPKKRFSAWEWGVEAQFFLKPNQGPAPFNWLKPR